LRGDRDLVQPARLVEQLLSRRQGEAGERGAPDRRHGAEADESRDAQPLCRPFRLNSDRLSDLEVLLVRGRLVDHHVARLRPRSFDELERVEARGAVRDAESEVRRAAVDERLAALAYQLRLAVDA